MVEPRSGSAAHPQIVQVFLPLVIDRQFGDPIYRPIFEAAVRNDLSISRAARYQNALETYPRLRGLGG